MQHTYRLLSWLYQCITNNIILFLQIMQNEVARLVDGSRTIKMQLSLLFSDDFTFYQSVNTVTPQLFNSYVYLYHSFNIQLISWHYYQAIKQFWNLDMNCLNSKFDHGLYKMRKGINFIQCKRDEVIVHSIPRVRRMREILQFKSGWQSPKV